MDTYTHTHPSPAAQGKFVFQYFGWRVAAAATPVAMLLSGATFFGLSLAANQGISVWGMDPAAMAFAGVAAGAVTQVRTRARMCVWVGWGGGGSNGTDRSNAAHMGRVLCALCRAQAPMRHSNQTTSLYNNEKRSTHPISSPARHSPMVAWHFRTLNPRPARPAPPRLNRLGTAPRSLRAPPSSACSTPPRRWST
jgi:hypothetical protein